MTFRLRLKPSVTARPASRWWLGTGFALLVSSRVLPAPPVAGDAPGQGMFRVGFSSTMFTDVNVNDGRAAVKVWAQTIARERGIPTNPEPLILTGVKEIAGALHRDEVDAISLPVDEYWLLSQQVPLAPIFVARFSGSTEEEYVLLVHRDSGFEKLADLRGRSLTVFQNPRACLAPLWLDTLLAEQGLPSQVEFMGKMSGGNRVSRVVLPVFFRQSDACVVTRSGFDAVKELNPQIGRVLKVLATSPKVVPAVMGLRAHYAPSFKERLLAGLRDLHLTPAGQQVLTIFQCERLEEHPASCLESALRLLETHARLVGGNNSPSAAVVAPRGSHGESPGGRR